MINLILVFQESADLRKLQPLERTALAASRGSLDIIPRIFYITDVGGVWQNIGHLEQFA